MKYQRPSVFCDWLSIYQDHVQYDDAGNRVFLPVINGGHVVKFEPDAFAKSWTIDAETGEAKLLPVFDASKAVYTTQTKIQHEGSYETAISFRCDGERVEISGNISRFGRPDNLFGLTVPECVEKASEIAASLGLPAFSDNADRTQMARTDTHVLPPSVAKITRVDLTQNFATGSRKNALRYIHSMTGQASMVRGKGNKTPKGYGNGVTWNEGSKRWYSKLYFKGDELGKFASEEVQRYCEDNGIVRFEVSIKSRELADRGLNRILAWCKVKEGKDMGQVIYGQFDDVLNRNSVSTLDLSDIPGKLGLVAESYMTGGNPYGKMTERTARRTRKALLQYGIDIAVPLDVTRLSARVEVIQLQPLEIPAWYNFEAA